MLRVLARPARSSSSRAASRSTRSTARRSRSSSIRAARRRRVRARRPRRGPAGLGRAARGGPARAARDDPEPAARGSCSTGSSAPESRIWQRFRVAPAAKYYHQAYPHGLLDHTRLGRPGRERRRGRVPRASTATSRSPARCCTTSARPRPTTTTRWRSTSPTPAGCRARSRSATTWSAARSSRSRASTPSSPRRSSTSSSPTTASSRTARRSSPRPARRPSSTRWTTSAARSAASTGSSASSPTARPGRASTAGSTRPPTSAAARRLSSHSPEPSQGARTRQAEEQGLLDRGHRRLGKVGTAIVCVCSGHGRRLSDNSRRRHPGGFRVLGSGGHVREGLRADPRGGLPAWTSSAFPRASSRPIRSGFTSTPLPAAALRAQRRAVQERGRDPRARRSTELHVPRRCGCLCRRRRLREDAGHPGNAVQHPGLPRPDGTLLGKRQKLMPTVGERLVHTGGSGDRLGGLRDGLRPRAHSSAARTPTRWRYSP